MELNIATLSLHADSHNTPDITAPLHVSTTFKYPKGFNDAKAIEKGYLKQDPIHIDDFHIYSRMTTETRTRLEQVLGSYENSYATSYSSGLAAIYALLTNVQPKIIAMHKEGYHGTHGTVELYSRNRDIKIIYVEDENLDLLNAGDLLLLESPMNPRGEVYDIRAYKNIIKEGVVLAVDSTFCPPPLQTLHSHGIYLLSRC
jgi:cystathionine beta-lyase